MRSLIFLICGFFTITWGQVVQITNIHGNNCSNFNSLAFPNNQGYYAFEAVVGNNSDIYLGKYDAIENKFTTLQNITSNFSVNKYPNLYMRNDTLYILYQSAISGQTKIVYKTFVNNTLSDYKIASGNIQVYCTNPGLSMNGFYGGSDSVYFYFTANNSIYFKSLFDPGEPVEVFAGDMDVQFSSASFITSGSETYAAALMKGFNSQSNTIQVKKRTASGWDFLHVFSSGKENNNLRFVRVDYTVMLAWDVTDGNRKDIYLMTDLSDTNSVTKLHDSYPYSNFDFHADQNKLIVDNIPIMYSNAFKVLRNDSLFIRVNKPDVVLDAEDTLVYTSVPNTSLYVGHLGNNLSGEIFYSVWEDSTGNEIQLFGRKSIEVVSGIEKSDHLTDFNLEQNYPNPFNPSTKIKYSLPEAGKVRIMVYDVLGREVNMIVNEYKNPGSYEVTFNADNLSSGIYFYRISLGNYTSTKKMMLIR